MLAAANSPLHKPNDMLWVRGIKTYLDGGMLTGSAYMLQPWGVSKVYSIDDPAYRGMRYIDPGKLYQIAKFALANDLQFTAHSVGDGAVQAMVDAYSEIDNDFPVRAAQAEHHACQLHSERAALDQIKQLGIILDLQPAWLMLDGATLEKQFGYDRLSMFQPYKTLFDRGIPVGGGSDHMQKIGSFRSDQSIQSVPRDVDHPHTAAPVDRQGAASGTADLARTGVRLYTINNAFITFAEKQKGSLEPGKLADFVVIDRDFLTCPVEQIRDIKVEETWLGGRQVYERSSK